MNYEALQAAWASSGNNLDAATRTYVIAEAHATLKRRNAQVRRMLWFAGVMLIVPMALMGVDLVTGQVDAIDLRREWGLIPFAMIPCIALFVIARRATPKVQTNGALIDAFRALRTDNAAARLRIVIVCASMIVFAPLLLVLLNQLVLTGKMAPHEMQSAAIILGGALALSAIWMIMKYLTQLAPEGRQLNELIAHYETP